ncbi:MAG: response regulator [Armatimonadetes bacterium]|nr:response regulator [Anaerolineae bacterium]
MTKSILIVEDDPDGQAVVAHVVGYLNIPHDVVGDAEKAIKMLVEADQKYQAVIIDLALPGKDGWELLTMIRNNPATAALICVAVTGFHTSKIRGEAIRAGFNAYFAKPLDATHFARELGALL